MDVEPMEAESVLPRLEGSAGRLRVRGLGYVETAFVSLRDFPVLPVDSVLMLRERGATKARTLARSVLHSVLLAIVRRWGGLLAVLGALTLVVLVTNGQWRYATVSLVAVCVAPILSFAASWWPLGVARHATARAIATSAGLPSHDVDLAYGVITRAQHADAERQWRRERAEADENRRHAYEDGLRAMRERRRARKAAPGRGGARRRRHDRTPASTETERPPPSDRS
ncbi:MAG: hypothetical protein K0V04_23625 [Deltaproteobacteria bacterium]|nr:hypothetical protein [Deltaproteobacteria bacterium]